MTDGPGAVSYTHLDVYKRQDHAYSWAYPLAAHGMMHTVIRNAWAGDPYKIDTLLMLSLIHI